MCFYEELHCKLCLQSHGAKFDSYDFKKHFYAVLTSRDSCYNWRNSLTRDLKVQNAK